MRLTVLGGSGGTGGCLVDQALAAGHEVTVPVREPSRVRRVDDPRLRVVKADVRDAAALEPLVAGRDAVLSALGPRSRKAEDAICEAAARSTVAAMRSAGVRRLVVVSAAPVAPPDPREPPLYRLAVKRVLWTVFRRPYDDLAAMEDVVRASGLEWTIVRPPRLRNTARTGRYRTAADAPLRNGMAISRADLADAMLRALDDPATVGAGLQVAY